VCRLGSAAAPNGAATLTLRHPELAVASNLYKVTHPAGTVKRFYKKSAKILLKQYETPLQKRASEIVPSPSEKLGAETPN
jgi:hypothetical protein